MSKTEALANAFGAFFNGIANFFGKSKERLETRRESHQMQALRYADKFYDEFDIDWFESYMAQYREDRQDWAKWIKARNLFNYTKRRYKAHRSKT